METSEKTKKPGFSRLSVVPKQQVTRKRDTHPDELLYMKLMLGNRRNLWLPIGISPDLLKCFSSSVFRHFGIPIVRSAAGPEVIFGRLFNYMGMERFDSLQPIFYFYFSYSHRLRLITCISVV